MNPLVSLSTEINAEHQQAKTAAVEAVEHARRCGELLIEVKASLPHGEFAAWVAANCEFSDRTARAYMQLHRELPKLEDQNGNAVADLPLRDALAAIAEPKPPANYSSASNEWYTPPVYVEAVRELLGRIDLDPATCERANATVQAAEFFTAETSDTLDRQWHGNVFMNPPYGKDGNDSRAGLFCQKAIAEYYAGNIDEAVILVNSVHSQKWQAPLYDFPVCLVDHRIAFISGAGTPNGNPTFQNVFVYLGMRPHRFTEVFSRFGYVLFPPTVAA